MHGRVQSSAGDECGELCSPQECSFWIPVDLQNVQECAEVKARRAAKKRARVEPEHVVELPRLDELPGYDDDEGVISD